MSKTVARIAVLVAVFLLTAFLVFLVNQTAQVVALADRIHPVLGDVTLWGLLLVYAACLAVPAYLFLRLPKPLRPPAREDSPEFERHLEALRRRLLRNPRLAGRPLGSRQEIEAALRELDAEADRRIQASGSQVFVTTAVSQNGSLDAVLVLAAQSKMVWQIARLYYQRPTLRDLVYLYANVASTAFIAGELEDLDLSEQVQPVVSAVLGSMAGTIPGLQMTGSLLVTSVFNGTANAFLTLRVGITARRYCGSLVLPEKGVLRRSAIAAAAQMLGAIAFEGSRRLSGAFVKASTRRVGDAVRGLGGKVRDAGTSVANRLPLPGRRREPSEGS